MNDPVRLPVRPGAASHAEESSSAGPNLTLLYSLIALALIVAIGLAVMIVLPFYHRH
ncbi:MAG: hypothetical protein ABSD67_26735 [Terracidiphilus sp.]|jgi:hypothetical protein